MATVTKSIGTSSRDYSTITAWEADLDDTNIYTSGDDAVGECYDDSAFSESTITLNASRVTTLRPATGERHDGTVGTGVRIVTSNTNGKVFYTVITGVIYTIDGIEFNSNTNGNDGAVAVYIQGRTTLTGCIVHNMFGAGNAGKRYGILTTGVNGGHTINCLNNIVYDIGRDTGTGGSECVGIIQAVSSLTGKTINIHNNTIYDIYTAGFYSYGIGGNIGPEVYLKNNLVADLNVSGTGSGGSVVAYPSFSDTTNVSNNASYDTTAPGSNAVTNASAANQFVSTVSGSEDLHLKSGADAIGAGVDLATSSLDINGSDRNALAATVWDIGAHQFASTASIGSTGRDYSTITLWEADLDDTTIYGAGANAVGECYNDSTFTQTDNLIIRSGGAVGLNSVTLTAATTDRHDGTAGTGAEIGVASFKRIYMQAGYNASVSIKNVVSWLDINGQGYGRTALFAFYTGNDELKNCICRSVGDQVLPPRNCYNNIIYTGGSFIYNANYGTVYAADVLNNTVYGVNRGITVDIANSNVSIKNNICAGTSIVDFDGNFGNVGYGVPQVSNNLSSDATAPGTNSLINKSAAKQFVSTLSGSEDLHLKFISAAIDAGVDLGTTPDGVQYDINGKDRDAENSIWDIGAHEFGDNVVYGLFTVL